MMKRIRAVLPALIITGVLLAGTALQAQVTVTRQVIGGGGGTTASSGHTIRGTLSQTAVGRLTHGGTERHDVGFWYWAYPAGAATRVSLPALEAEPGTRLTVPLHLTVSSDRLSSPFLPRPFRARIRYNRTLLRPVGNTPACTYDGDDCLLEVAGIANTQDGAIADLEFLVMLGNAESTPLTIEEFTWETSDEERIATLRQHGALRLLGVCREGDHIRLISSVGVASRIRVWPNPVADLATLEFVSVETGPVEVRLVDLLGSEVATLVKADAEAQRLYRLEFDFSRVPSGSYLLLYNTPTQIMTARVLVAQ